uniref:ATPase subunit 4 n=1 Tax=Viscum scurruloideum TaxID=1664545 RepID=A0A0H3WGT8_9MAGN|nr:ATPase subunit 4 [Viscum scurruloideum]
MHGRVAWWSMTILASSSKQISIVNEESIVAPAASCIYLFLRWNGQFFTRSMEVRIQQQSDAIFQFINQCINNYMKQAIEQRLSSAASSGLAQVVDALPIETMPIRNGGGVGGVPFAVVRCRRIQQEQLLSWRSASAASRRKNAFQLLASLRLGLLAFQ